MADFQIIAQLGEGRLGRVYLARDPQGALVALKQGAADDIAREAAVLAQLTHPSIIKLLATDEHPPTLVLEYLRGKTLATYLSAPIAPPVAAAITVQLAEALWCAHAQGVLHRDVKPENIFVEADGRVVLADFGVAAALGVLSDRSGERVTGTPLYLSPEQLGAPVPLTAASDIYALGVILYQLLSGHLPYVAVDFATLVTAITEKPPLPLPARLPLATTVEQMLSKQPAERPDALTLAATMRVSASESLLREWVASSGVSD